MSDDKPWEKVADPSYLRKVMGNMVDLGFGPKNPVPCLRFGMTGIGYAPNYQIEAADCAKHCFRGMGHGEAAEAGEEFAPGNLSLSAFTYTDVQGMLARLVSASSR